MPLGTLNDGGLHRSPLPKYVDVESHIRGSSRQPCTARSLANRTPQLPCPDGLHAAPEQQEDPSTCASGVGDGVECPGLKPMISRLLAGVV
jgi:hypothetical protein